MKSFTLRVDEQTYNEYAAIALLDGRNVTTALRQHMEDVAAHRLPKQELEKINAQVDDALKDIVDNKTMDILVERIAQRLGVLAPREVVSEIPEVSMIDTNVVILERSDGSSLSRHQDTSGVTWVSDTGNQVEIPQLPAVSKLIEEETENSANPIAENNNLSDRKKSQSKKSTEIKNKTVTVGSEPQRKTRNLRTFPDGEVAIAEGVSTETIRRYRVGARKPKDQGFWDRWEICDWNDKRWIKK